MKTIADFHLHSKYSRATSPQMDAENLALWAGKKGIDIVATGDFTHPKYLQELKDKLIEDGSGLLKLKIKNPKLKISFILSSEIACIYKDKWKTRRLHIVILAPDFATVDKIVAKLTDLKCNLRSDGRPIIGLSAKRLAEICFEANSKTLVIPAHAWTPWFSIFGSFSGYDTMEECFEDLTPNIYAIETGLSSDPAMNWRWSELDRLTLISNSDAHSPRNLGREANVFDLEEFTYDEIYKVIKEKDKKKFLYTIEFFPEEGMYHYDGHRACKFVCAPNETKLKYKNICPVCGKKMTLGVDHRVDDLSDRALGAEPANRIPFVCAVPLEELIAESYDQNKKTKAVKKMYEHMLESGVNEFNILLDLNREEIIKISNDTIAEAIMRVRDRNVIKSPGFDGQYGTVKVFQPAELDKWKLNQKKLFN